MPQAQDDNRTHVLHLLGSPGARRPRFFPGRGKGAVLSQVARIDSCGARSRLSRALWGEMGSQVLTGDCKWSAMSCTPAGPLIFLWTPALGPF